MTNHDKKVKSIITRKNSHGDLYHRESTWLEFKESFSHGSWDVYLRCMASFANRSGGYLIFGIKEKPKRTASGLKDKAKEVFIGLDSAIVSTNISNHFSPQINFELGLLEVDSKWFGYILYI